MATNNGLNLITPAGRIVQGSLSKPSMTDMHGKPRLKPQYFFALAISKNDPQVGPLLEAVFNFAKQSYFQYPEVQARIALGIRAGTNFAWKIEDGDVVKPGKEKKAYLAGCWIFKFSTTLPIPCVDANNINIDPQTVKTGYFAQVAIGVAPNNKLDHTCGLYMNPKMVRMVGYGEEIVAAPSATSLFGTAPAQTMGSPTPVAPSGGFAGVPAQTMGGYVPQPVATVPAQTMGGYVPQPVATVPTTPAITPEMIAAMIAMGYIQAPTPALDPNAAAAAQAAQATLTTVSHAPMPGLPSGDSVSATAFPIEPSPVEGFALNQ